LTNPYSEYGSKKLLDDNVKGQVAHATFKVRNSRISYPKDSSTSFLITRSCYALTDSYVSKIPSSSGGTVNSRMHSLDQLIGNLSAQLEERRQHFIKTCSDCSKEAFEKMTKRIQDKIDSAAKEQERLYRQIPLSTGRAETLSANFNSNSYSLDVVERNEGLGVSLLRINSNTACEPVTIGDSHSLKPGDEIFMMGASGRVADGVVTGFTTTNSGHGLITHTASAASIGGLLGTPLFNKKGEVLGINVNGIGNERYALRIEEVLEEFGIVP
jgi:S1-C subfamily serine protease